MAMQKIAALCLIFISSSAHAVSTTLSDAINQGSQAITRSRVGSSATDAPDAHTISVTGTVTSPSGDAARNFMVKAFTGKMGGNQLAGSAVTDDGGAYTIAFPSNDSVTIVVKVYCKSTPVATSAPQYNVTEGVSIDVTVPNTKCEPGISLKQPRGPARKTGN